MKGLAKRFRLLLSATIELSCIMFGSSFDLLLLLEGGREGEDDGEGDGELDAIRLVPCGYWTTNPGASNLHCSEDWSP